MLLITCISDTHNNPAIEISYGLAAIIGFLANYRVLVLDLGETPGLSRSRLMVGDDPGLELLADKQLSSGKINWDDILRAIIPIHANTYWGNDWEGRGFQLITGPRSDSIRYRDIFRDSFAQLLVEQILQNTYEQPYECMIINCEHTINSLWSEYIFRQTDYVFFPDKVNWFCHYRAFSKSKITLHEIIPFRTHPFPFRPQTWISGCSYPSGFCLSGDEFYRSLIGSEKEYPQAISKVLMGHLNIETGRELKNMKKPDGEKIFPLTNIKIEKIK
jgi:hypothetical protein